MPDADSYVAPVDYLVDALHKLDLYLDVAAARLRGVSPEDRVNGRGERGIVNEITWRPGASAEGVTSVEHDPELASMIELAARQQQHMEAKCQRSREAGEWLPIDRLRDAFDLTELDTDILCLCLAPSVDARYESLFAYIQDDMTKRYPTLQLMEMVFMQTLHQRVQVRQRVTAAAPLMSWQFLHFDDTARSRAMPMLSMPLHVDQRLVDYLMGVHAPDASLADIVRDVEIASDALPFEPGGQVTQQQLKLYLRELADDDRHHVLYFYGAEGAGRRRAAADICAALGQPLLEVDWRTLHEQGADANRIRRIIRESRLRDAPLLVPDIDTPDASVPTRSREATLAALVRECPLVLLTGTNLYTPSCDLHPARFLALHIPTPDYQARKAIWQQALREVPQAPHRLTPDVLAGNFQFTPGQIRRAVAAAQDAALARGDRAARLQAADLLSGCRAQCNQRLAELAERVVIAATWSDLVLPSAALQQLQELEAQHRHRNQVYDHWGFRDKLPYGRGIKVLFSGSSGTGKTMAAGILANALELELYKIDLSRVVSKYIGETEKNLARIFHEAATSNAILFFDEADALFGKRTEVKDAHDRYANIETSFLLQQMEAYDGLTILASNLRKNMDDAFVRRLHAVVEFPFPDAALRRRLWRGMFPDPAPMTLDDADFDFLAERLEVAGGHIKNIVIRAAFYAASEAADIHLPHLIRAAKRELTQMGKAFSQSEFDAYMAREASDG